MRKKRFQRVLLGLLMGAIAGLLDRRVRKRVSPPSPRGNIEASD